MEQRFCPKCGAYWQCECILDEPTLRLPETLGCEHDWTETVGVEIDASLDLNGARVVVCRLCGLYAVAQESV
jgi:hypothetical protein